MDELKPDAGPRTPWLASPVTRAFALVLALACLAATSAAHFAVSSYVGALIDARLSSARQEVETFRNAAFKLRDGDLARFQDFQSDILSKVGELAGAVKTLAAQDKK